MDLLGTAMGLVTIPMAILTVGSALSAVAMLLTGHDPQVVWGFAALAVGVSFAPLLERVIVLIDDAAMRTQVLHGRSAATPFAALSGALPMAIILGWELVCFHLVRSNPGDAHSFTVWLWSYGIAAGPWTIFALRVSRFRRTLCSIRAYAAHLAYWLLSALVALGHLSMLAAAAAMIVPAILPLLIGMLLAVADRDALSNVRV